MYRISLQQSADRPAIESLLDRTFGDNRFEKKSYRFRYGVDPVIGLSFVAREGAAIVATIQHWPISIGADRAPALLLGPLGVEPKRKGEGIGQALVRHGLAAAASLGHERVVLVGDEPYYGRFGFRPASRFGVVMDDEAANRVLALALRTGGFGADGLISPSVKSPSASPRCTFYR